MIKKQDVLLILAERKQRLIGSLLDDMLEVELDILINKISNLPEEDEWIPVNPDDPETFPKDDDFILLSFENFSIPYIGRYEADETGGAFYLGDKEDSCASQGLIVNAWKPYPEAYRPKTKWKDRIRNVFTNGSRQ